MSRHGIIPIAHSQDTAGPMTRSVADAAIAMDAITGPDPLDPCPGRLSTPPTRFAKGLEGVDSAEEIADLAAWMDARLR